MIDYRTLMSWYEPDPNAPCVCLRLPHSAETGPVVPVATPEDAEAVETRSGGAA